MTSSGSIGAALMTPLPGRELARAARDQRRRDARRAATGPSSPSRRANSSSAALRPSAVGVLGDDREPGLDDVGERDVVEADERDVVLQAEVVERAHGADRDEVLAR